MYKKVSMDFHGRELSIEAGKIAKQASGAVIIRYGDTMILTTVTADKRAGQPGDFTPLTVNYQEKQFAAGKIPGGFFKRESRPTDLETLYCRLIDRPVRPLFPKFWTHETQIIPTVFSADSQSNPGVIAIIGASAALEISHIPFEGPLAAVQIGRVDGEWIINPSYEQGEESDVDLVVAGGRQGIAMVEGGSDIVSEDELLEAIFYGYEQLQPILDLQDELRREVGKPKVTVEPYYAPEELEKRFRDEVGKDLEEAWSLPGKMDRHDRLNEMWKNLLEKLQEEEVDLGPNKIYFNELQEKLDTEVLRKKITEDGKRADGRGPKDVRDITTEVSIFPRTHGSALFTRGETQGMVVTTLGTRKDERKIERLEDDYYKTFFLHYNFPPYCVGETRFRLGPGRREIGHGHLAERSLARVLPDHEDFPYTIRVVSEITESNGSSSMASVCGGSMSLMDAGVPIKAQVAGVAMGLVKVKEGEFTVLTDIMGDEDHCGDMDFKVAGTEEGITAVQMDIKVTGLEKEIMRKALNQAKEARLHILGKMNETIDKPRPELSRYAPRIVTVQIPVEKIKDLIGPGGKTIRGIVEQTGAEIDVDDTGTVRISSADEDVNKKVLAIIDDLTAEAEVDKVYTGTVRKVTDFGAFVEILPGTDGLVHISQLENHRVEKVTDVLREGDEVVVKCIGIDQDGKVSLSRKEVLDQQPEGASKPRSPGDDPDAPAGTRPYPHDKKPGGRDDKRGGKKRPRHKK